MGGESNPDTLLQYTHILTHCIHPQSTPVTAKRDGLACCHSPPLPKHTTHCSSEEQILTTILKTWRDIKVAISAAKYKVLAFQHLQSLPALRCQNARAPSRLICCTNSDKYPLKMDVRITVAAAKNNVPGELKNSSHFQFNLN